MSNINEILQTLGKTQEEASEMVLGILNAMDVSVTEQLLNTPEYLKLLQRSSNNDTVKGLSGSSSYN
jgi:hypothetical protein